MATTPCPITPPADQFDPSCLTGLSVTSCTAAIELAQQAPNSYTDVYSPDSIPIMISDSELPVEAQNLLDSCYDSGCSIVTYDFVNERGATAPSETPYMVDVSLASASGTGVFVKDGIEGPVNMEQPPGYAFDMYSIPHSDANFMRTETGRTEVECTTICSLDSTCEGFNFINTGGAPMCNLYKNTDSNYVDYEYIPDSVSYTKTGQTGKFRTNPVNTILTNTGSMCFTMTECNQSITQLFTKAFKGGSSWAIPPFVTNDIKACASCPAKVFTFDDETTVASDLFSIVGNKFSIQPATPASQPPDTSIAGQTTYGDNQKSIAQFNVNPPYTITISFKLNRNAGERILFTLGSSIPNNYLTFWADATHVWFFYQSLDATVTTQRVSYSVGQIMRITLVATNQVTNKMYIDYDQLSYYTIVSPVSYNMSGTCTLIIGRDGTNTHMTIYNFRVVNGQQGPNDFTHGNVYVTNELGFTTKYQIPPGQLTIPSTASTAMQYTISTDASHVALTTGVYTLSHYLKWNGAVNWVRPSTGRSNMVYHYSDPTQQDRDYPSVLKEGQQLYIHQVVGSEFVVINVGTKQSGFEYNGDFVNVQYRQTYYQTSNTYYAHTDPIEKILNAKYVMNGYTFKTKRGRTVSPSATANGKRDIMNDSIIPGQPGYLDKSTGMCGTSADPNKQGGVYLAEPISNTYVCAALTARYQDNPFSEGYKNGIFFLNRVTVSPPTFATIFNFISGNKYFVNEVTGNVYSIAMNSAKNGFDIRQFEDMTMVEWYKELDGNWSNVHTDRLISGYDLFRMSTLSTATKYPDPYWSRNQQLRTLNYKPKEKANTWAKANKKGCDQSGCAAYAYYQCTALGGGNCNPNNGAAVSGLVCSGTGFTCFPTTINDPAMVHFVPVTQGLVLTTFIVDNDAGGGGLDNRHYPSDTTVHAIYTRNSKPICNDLSLNEYFPVWSEVRKLVKTGVACTTNCPTNPPPGYIWSATSFCTPDLCAAGYACPGNNTKTRCSPPNYADSPGSSICKACGLGSITTDGISCNACPNTPAPGYIYSGAGCGIAQCLANQYKLTDFACAQCPSGQRSPAGSNSINDCKIAVDVEPSVRASLTKTTKQIEAVTAASIQAGGAVAIPSSDVQTSLTKTAKQIEAAIAASLQAVGAVAIPSSDVQTSLTKTAKDVEQAIVMAITRQTQGADVNSDVQTNLTKIRGGIEQAIVKSVPPCNTTCPSGQYISTQCTAASDRLCTPCQTCAVAPLYSTLTQTGCADGDGVYDRLCSYACNSGFTPAGSGSGITCTCGNNRFVKSLTECAMCASCTVPSNASGSSTGCTGTPATSDRVCSFVCVGSYYKNAAGTACDPWTVCASGTEYETGTPSATDNRICGTCRKCTTPANASDASTGCSGTNNRTCGFTCNTNYYKNADGTACTACKQASDCTPSTLTNGTVTISGCTNTGTSPGTCTYTCNPEFTSTSTNGVVTSCTCPDGRYINSLNECVPCTSCPANTTSTVYSITGCSGNTGPGTCGITCQNGYTNVNGTCTCIAGYYISSSDQICRGCIGGSYSSAAGSTSCTKCKAGTYQPNAGSSSCLPCGNSVYSSAGASMCTSWTNCGTGYYSANTPNTTTDRICGLCTNCGTGQYQTGACANGNGTKDRTCAKCTNCENNQYQTGACANGNGTNDRTCAKCTYCGNNQYQTQVCANGNGTNDRMCANCTNCENNQYQTGACANGTGTNNRTCGTCTDCSGMTYGLRTRLIETQTECSNGNGTQNRVCQACPNIYICGGQNREFYIYNHLKSEYVGGYAGGSVDTTTRNPTLATDEPYTWYYNPGSSSLVASNRGQRVHSNRFNRVYWTSTVSNFTSWSINQDNYYALQPTLRGTHVTINSIGDVGHHLNNCKDGSNLQSFNGNSPGCDTFSLIFKDTVLPWASSPYWSQNCPRDSLCPPIGQTFTVPAYTP